MLPAERYEKVKAHLQQHRYANINELAEMFHTSTPTIRRCLKQLENNNIVESVRGGAVYIGSSQVVEQPYNIKKQQNFEEKRRIAREAVRRIQPESCIFMDSSSTVYEMIHAFSEDMHSLTICTNDVKIAESLSTRTDITVLVTGGILRRGYYTLSGNFAETLLNQIRIDCAFLSVDAITPDGFFTITNAEESGVKRAIFQNANERILLCDHSKFGKTALINLWDPEKVNTIITGKELSDEYYDRYTQMGYHIVRV